MDKIRNTIDWWQEKEDLLMTKKIRGLREILEKMVEGITVGYKEGLNCETYPEENYMWAIEKILAWHNEILNEILKGV